MDNTNAGKKVSQADLAQAFTDKSSPKTPQKDKRNKKPKSLIVSVVLFVLGVIALIAGVVVLILKFTGGERIADGEYLVKAEEWALDSNTNCIEPDSQDVDAEDEEKLIPNCSSDNAVIWKFTEIGKGTLTTNSHKNDYDFIWAIEDGKLKIETKWLYDIVNEYEYDLNQKDKTMTLTDGETKYVFEGKFAETQ